MSKRGPSGEVKSLFTSRIIEGMEGGQADLDGDGFISVDELYNYIEERIRCEDPAQRPLKSGFTHDQLWLGRALPRKDAIPRNVLDLLNHTLAIARLAGIDELQKLLSVNEHLYSAALPVLNKLRSDFDSTVKLVATNVVERLEAQRREREEIQRLEAEQREKDRVEAERLEKERLDVEQREKERLEAEQREKQRLEAEQRERQRLEAEQREKERLEAEALQPESEGRQQQEEDAAPPIIKPSFSREGASSPQNEVLQLLRGGVRRRQNAC
jgi:hypothetical protein